jgi:hypothetical protein
MAASDAGRSGDDPPHGGRSLRRQLHQTVWHAERTFYNTLGVAKNLMSRRVRECGYKCVITGEGADELFAGYPAFKRDMFLHGIEHEPPERARANTRGLDRTNKLFKGAILAENGGPPSGLGGSLRLHPLVDPAVDGHARAGPPAAVGRPRGTG